MARLAFFGLGQMGTPMAGRLLEAGHELTVWNRTPSKADPLVERGARRAASPDEAARDAQAASRQRFVVNRALQDGGRTR